jgi:hypothetical protein
MPPLPERAIRQPLSAATARDLGIGRHEFNGPLWTPMLRGARSWFDLDRAAPLTRIIAAVEVLPNDVVLGGWAALHLLGVRDIDGRAGRRLRPVQVCIGPVGRARPRSALEIDRGTLLTTDVTDVDGILVTVPERACADIARRSGVEEGVVAGDAACRAGVTTPEAIRGYVGTLLGVRGVPRARAAAALIDGAAASCPESRLRVVWVTEAGLPRPLVNARVVDELGFVLGIADLLDVESATVGEYDGAQHRDLRQHTQDNIREEGLEEHNLVVVRATAVDLWSGRSQLVRRIEAGRRRGLARDRSRDTWRLRT